MHVKDIAPAGEAADEDGWADLGAGTVDWAGLIGALKARRCGSASWSTTIRATTGASRKPRSPPRGPCSRRAEMAQPLGVGIIGCGNISTDLLPLAPLFRGIEIRAVADLDPAAAETRAAEYGVAALGRRRAARRAGHRHRRQPDDPRRAFPVTRAILEAGKHAYSEKPLVALRSRTAWRSQASADAQACASAARPTRSSAARTSRPAR